MNKVSMNLKKKESMNPQGRFSSEQKDMHTPLLDTRTKHAFLE